MQAPNISGMDLNLLIALEALLTERHVSRAAARLGTSQPSLSRSLAELRRWFDDPLFLRGRHGLMPTPRALAIEPEVRAVLEKVQSMVVGADRFEPATSKRIFRVALTEYPQCMLFPPLLRRLHEVAPGVSVHVLPLSLEFTDALESGALDLVLAPLGDLPRGLHGEDVLADRMVCALRKEHPAAAASLSLARFVQLGHLQISPLGHSEHFVDELLAEQGLSRRVVMHAPSFVAACLLVAESDLLSVLPSLLVERFAAPLGLVAKRAPVDLPGVLVRQIWHARAAADQGNAWLRAEIQKIGALLPKPVLRSTARLALGKRTLQRV